MKKQYILALLLLLLLAIGAAAFYLLSQQWTRSTEEKVRDAVAEAYAASSQVASQATEAEEAEEATPYESPVDFAALQAENADIYAWLYIPGTEISYPILQNAEDDSYYLSHNSDGETAASGAIYTEATYTSKDFSDPVTVIYGHRVNNGTMFGNLNALYSVSDGIETYSEIVVYLPDRELHYTVFAALPYDNRHILYCYNFQNTSEYQLFLKNVLNNRELGAQFVDAESVTAEDQLLILSTCLYTDTSKRYLVLAKCVEIF